MENTKINFEKSIDRFNNFLNDPKNFIYDYFAKIISKVDLRREKFLEAINNESISQAEILIELREKFYDNVIKHEAFFNTLKKYEKNLRKGFEEKMLDDFELNESISQIENYILYLKGLLVDNSVFTFKRISDDEIIRNIQIDRKERFFLRIDFVLSNFSKIEKIKSGDDLQTNFPLKGCVD
jgi:hypothetical protein